MPNPIVNNRLYLGGQDFDSLRPTNQAEGVALETNNKVKALLGYTVTIGEHVVNKASLKKWLKRTGYADRVSLALKSKDIQAIIERHIANRIASKNPILTSTDSIRQPTERDSLELHLPEQALHHTQSSSSLSISEFVEDAQEIQLPRQPMSQRDTTDESQTPLEAFCSYLRRQNQKREELDQTHYQKKHQGKMRPILKEIELNAARYRLKRKAQEDRKNEMQTVLKQLPEAAEKFHEKKESDEQLFNYIMKMAGVSNSIRQFLSQKRKIAEVGYLGYFKDNVMTELLSTDPKELKAELKKKGLPCYAKDDVMKELLNLDPSRFKANLQKIGAVEWQLENKAIVNRVQALQQAFMARTTARRAQEGANQLRAEEQERKKQRTVIMFDEPVASSIKLPLTAQEMQPLLKPMVDSLLVEATELAAQEKASEIAPKEANEPTKQVTSAPEKLEVRVLNQVKTGARTFGFVETPSSMTAKFLAPFKQLFRQ